MYTLVMSQASWMSYGSVGCDIDALCMCCGCLINVLWMLFTLQMLHQRAVDILCIPCKVVKYDFTMKCSVDAL